MAKVTFYGYISDTSVKEFIQEVDTIEDGVLDLALNTSGGGVFAGYGMIQCFVGFEGEKNVFVHGNASSMGVEFLCRADKATALNVSQFVVHRADDYWVDGTTRTILVNMNKEAEKAFRAKVDVDKFEKIAGMTVKRIFDTDQEQIDVVLTAKQAKSIGLIDKIVDLSSKQLASINQELIANSCDPIEAAKVQPLNEPIQEQLNDSEMTLTELKAKHPDLHTQIFEAGRYQGVESEKERAAAWIEFLEVDPAAVREGIQGDKPMTQLETAKFSKKYMQSLAKLEANSADDLDTSSNDEKEDEGEGEGNEETAKFNDSIRAKLGLTTKETEDVK